MAKDLNRCEFIGRLGRDPEVRYTAGGAAVANFSIAVGDQWRDKEGEKQESTEWVTVEAWGKLAELCETYLAKGDRIYASGKMVTQSWEDQDGNTRYKTFIRLQEIQFLNTNGGSGDGDKKDSKGGGKSNGKSGGKSGGKGGGKPPVDDDSIPF